DRRHLVLGLVGGLRVGEARQADRGGAGRGHGLEEDGGASAHGGNSLMGWRLQYPRRRGSQSAVSGTNRTNRVARTNETISQPTQGTVWSMRTLGRRHATIRFTAIGGVNWPIAIFIVRSTPNQTGSQAKAIISG